MLPPLSILLDAIASSLLKYRVTNIDFLLPCYLWPPSGFTSLVCSLCIMIISWLSIHWINFTSLRKFVSSCLHSRLPPLLLISRFCIYFNDIDMILTEYNHWQSDQYSSFYNAAVYTGFEILMRTFVLKNAQVWLLFNDSPMLMGVSCADRSIPLSLIPEILILLWTNYRSKCSNTVV